MVLLPGGEVGGEVVAGRQQRVQGGGDGLGEDTWSIKYHRIEESGKFPPIIGLLLSSLWCVG